MSAPLDLAALYRTDPTRACRLALRRANRRNRYSAPVDTALRSISADLGLYGVESLRAQGEWSRYWCDTVAVYVNAGETYAATVLYDVRLDRYTVTSYGDWVEAMERRGIYKFE